MNIGDKVKIKVPNPKFGWGGSSPGDIGIIIHIETIKMDRLFRKPLFDIFWVGVDFPTRRKYADLCLAVEPSDLEKIENDEENKILG